MKAKQYGATHYRRKHSAGESDWWPIDAAFGFGVPDAQLTTVCVAQNGMVGVTQLAGPFPKTAPVTTTTTAAATTTTTTTLAQYTVTTTKSGTGSGTTSGDGTYSAGASVSLTATAGSGSTFMGWTSGPCTTTTNSPCTFTISGNVTANAKFDVNAAPVATVSGSTICVLGSCYGIYTYTDAESDPEGTSQYQWYVADDASVSQTRLSPA